MAFPSKERTPRVYSGTRSWLTGFPLSTFAVFFSPHFIVCFLTGASAQSHEARAVLFYSQGHLSSALTELQDAVQAEPGKPFYRFMLGNAFYRSGRIEEAAAEYEASTRLDPARVEAHMCAGFSLYELGRLPAALNHFTQAMRLEPSSAFARAGLAVALFSTGDTSNALIQYAEAVRLENRYGNPAALAIDIRWKSQSLQILNKLRALTQETEKGDR